MEVKIEDQKVLISILNWNAAAATLKCLDSIFLQSENNLKVELVVIDNGSTDDEWKLLSEGAKARGLSIWRQQKNLGFAGGHNLSLVRAIEEKFDFVWLVNNDSLVEPDTLEKLISLLDLDQSCGAVAPVSVAAHDSEKIDFLGAMHDWKNLNSIKPILKSETSLLEERHPYDMWVAGTAVLFRVNALKAVGILDEDYFAYFEDDDIGARLAKDGWKSRVAFDAKITHACYSGIVTNRPPYFFYLMQRNYFLFWIKNTPKKFRNLLRLRLLDRSLYEVNRLYYRGFTNIADAALLGTSDGIFGRFGEPKLGRRVPIVITLLRSLFWFQHLRALRRLERMQS